MDKEKISQDAIFGLKNGNVVHISEISIEERGLNCNCYCVECNQLLIARLGLKNKHHFAHYSGSSETDLRSGGNHIGGNCNGSLETALHLFAKEVLVKNTKLVLPPLSTRYYINNNKVCFPKNGRVNNHKNYKKHVFNKKMEIVFDSVFTEHTIGDMRVDAILYKNNQPLIVELKVTHEVDWLKTSKAQQLNISMLEIDLSIQFKDYYDFNRVGVENAIINDIAGKQWIYNVNLEKNEQELKNRLESEIEEELRKQRKEYDRIREDNIRKENYKSKLRELKIKDLRQLLEPEYQKAQKEKWNKELSKNPNWIKEIRYLGATEHTLPCFLNKEIPGEFVFNCDRRIWQTKIFNIFINKWWQRKDIIENLSIKYLTTWVKEKSGIPLNKQLIYTKDVADEFPYLPSLSDVLFEFIMNLSEYDFVTPSDLSLLKNGNAYYWWFYKNRKDIWNSNIDVPVQIRIFR